jgi:hypothetical protein
MHPYLSEHLANQRREELLRDAAATYPSTSEGHLSTIANNRASLLYLLIGLPLAASKQPERDLLPDRARYSAAFRMISLVALSLGVLVGSLLDSRFGLASVAYVDGAVVAMLVGLVLSRSIGLLKTRAARHRQ